ncbi:MAG TPA: hypothetical protein VM261_18625 [Kofleriaceae bacterium]|nr:hypothetical protein [Kofleriaceae bacterium]
MYTAKYLVPGKCAECHAAITLPEDLEATTMTCPYCHASQPVPDLQTRQQMLLAHKREERIAEQQRAQEARESRREAREERERHEDKQEARRGRWGMRLTSLFAMLLAPTIIAVVVFDAPARLGFGDSGSGRLAQQRTLLAGQGCAPVGGISEQYATGNVSKLIPVAERQCIRVFAAGGDGHRSLSLRLFDADGKELTKAGDTTDPQLRYCAKAPTTVRYEVGVGPASKGRLSHMVLTCADAAK